jgi:hypothetical protein
MTPRAAERQARHVLRPWPGGAECRTTRSKYQRQPGYRLDRRQALLGALALAGLGARLEAEGLSRLRDSGSAARTPTSSRRNACRRSVLGASNSQPGVAGAPLSYDARGTRAVTVIFRFPADWTMTRPHYVNSDQEFLVLDGELEINGLRYRSGDYAYLPAGLPHTTPQQRTRRDAAQFL